MPETRPFVGREQETDQLARELDRNRPSVIVLYGRRRVGKSRLLSHVTRDRPTIYYQATEVVGSMNLDLLKSEIADFLDDSSAVLEGLEHWEGLLQYLADRVAERGSEVTLVLDEFPYLCDSVDGLPSIVQKVVDRIHEDDIPLDLVLCGSRISFMEELLGERNPLRGRQTLELELEPLPYRDAAQFLPDWSAIDKLRAFGVFGGMPYYLQLVRPDESFRTNVEQVVLESGAPLHNEILNVLRAELSSPTRYATILQAIANGCTTTGDIVGRAREIADGRALAPYLEKLRALRLIRAVRSLDAAPKSRNRRYYIADPFISFWYRFGAPNSSALAVGHASDVYEHAVEPDYDTYMGEIFEWIGRQYLTHYGSETLPAPTREVGKIWDADYDIDLAATLLDDTVVFGECKWWTAPVGRNVFDDLRDDAERTDYSDEADSTLYLLLAKSGFTDALTRSAADRHDLHLLAPDDLLSSPDTDP